MYRKFAFPDKIDEEHVNFYRQFGFIHFEHFMGAQDVQRIFGLVEQAQKKIIENKVAKVNGIPVRFGKDGNGTRIVQRLPFANVVTQDIAYLFADKRLDILRSFIPDHPSRLGLHEKDGVVYNYFINTHGSAYRQMGWHTDVSRDFIMLKKVLPMINIGIYLDDSGEHNGGLRVIPGTHKQSLFRTLFGKFQILNNKKDENEILIVAKAGDLVLHDGKLWHRVARSPYTGGKSTRRTIYIPLICGEPQLRSENSKTPFYQRLNRFVRYK